MPERHQHAQRQRADERGDEYLQRERQAREQKLHHGREFHVRPFSNITGSVTSARAVPVPKIRGIAEAKRTAVRELPGSREDSVRERPAASSRSAGRQAGGTLQHPVVVRDALVIPNEGYGCGTLS